MNIANIIIILSLAINQPEEDLFKKGIYLFEHQDFKQSVGVFNKIINNNLAKDENELSECYKYLGAAYFYLEDLKSAEANFRQLLFLKPETVLDPFIFPPSMVLFFDRIKKDLPKSDKSIQTNEIQRDYHFDLYINLLPLGLPQYAHNQNLKGGILLALQVIALTTNISAYWQIHSMLDKYGYVKNQDDADMANLLKTVQITALITFCTAYIYSVADGMYYSFSRPRGGK